MMWKQLGAVIFTVAAVYGCAGVPPGDGGPFPPPVQCTDVASRGNLNILTINLLFSEIETRDQRLDAIAQYAAGIPVDVILLQEVVGGVLVDTANSAHDLQEKLGARGQEYELRTAFETGVPGILAVANAVLSRCEIDFKIVKRLPRASELEFQGRVIKLPRNVMMTRLNIPGLGKLNVYNTHLCADCTASELGVQLELLLTFLEEVEGFFPGDNPVILGGDFNIDRFLIDPFVQRPFYDRILAADLTDAYAEDRTLEDLCEDNTVADMHCTVGVSSLDVGDSTRRIDYIFVDNVGDVNASRVVFNTLVNPTEPTVSDHAGVFVSVTLP